MFEKLRQPSENKTRFSRFAVLTDIIANFALRKLEQFQKFERIPMARVTLQA